MSHFLDRLMFFNRNQEPFAGGHGVVTDEDRTWEDAYRKRWQHDKIVRSTHGTNCTGSCRWKIYVKGGIVTWETQQTDYPRTRELLRGGFSLDTGGRSLLLGGEHPSRPDGNQPAAPVSQGGGPRVCCALRADVSGSPEAGLDGTFLNLLVSK